MFISVIIPTINRIKTLKAVIQSLVDQTLDKDLYEVIIMDQGANSETKKLVDKFSVTAGPKLNYISNSVPGTHSNRNIGVKKATGEIIVFLDDDTIADSNYLKVVYESFVKDPDIALMTGKVMPLYEDDDLPDWLDSFWIDDKWGKYIWEITLLDAGDSYKEIAPHLVFGCNYIVREDIYISHKGTYPDIFPREMIRFDGSGETLLATRIEEDGLKIIYNPDIKIKHIIPKNRLTFEYFYYRYYVMGIQH